MAPGEKGRIFFKNKVSALCLPGTRLSMPAGVGRRNPYVGILVLTRDAISGVPGGQIAFPDKVQATTQSQAIAPLVLEANGVATHDAGE